MKDEKLDTEIRAREKFQQLPNNVSEDFRKTILSDVGSSYLLLRKNGFTDDEASRFIVFVKDLEYDSE